MMRSQAKGTCAQLAAVDFLLFLLICRSLMTITTITFGTFSTEETLISATYVSFLIALETVKLRLLPSSNHRRRHTDLH